MNHFPGNTAKVAELMMYSMYLSARAVSIIRQLLSGNQLSLALFSVFSMHHAVRKSFKNLDIQTHHWHAVDHSSLNLK